MTEVLEFLRSNHFESPAHVDVFSTYSAGREVTVEVRDYGLGHDRSRYEVYAYFTDVPASERQLNVSYVLGNAADSAIHALEEVGMHWEVFKPTK